MIEEITTPVPINPLRPDLKNRKRRSLMIALGLPVITLLVIWMTTEKSSAPLKTVNTQKVENEQPFDPDILPQEIQAYFNGALDIAEAHCLNSFYKDPFSKEAKDSVDVAKNIHEIKVTTERFLDLFSKHEVRNGANQFKTLRALDASLRKQFNVPFIGGWAEQIIRWESQIEMFAERAYLEGYALVRTSPKEALEKYRLAIFLSNEKSRIKKKAQDAIRNLGLGVD
ncbi:MAG: hypothetical protein A3F16_01965 [Deltaproteobacteria bacterium RIFCSPHIGHO2_12_FULL_43_9]|nr:MAG: hypothetical protein A3F16_01965 [Deltaproteobacteria bacterium RIFCSPHIGHO2_12_FULL_43_9]